MSVDRTVARRAMAAALLIVVASCGDDEERSADGTTASICESAEADMGSVNGQKSLEENKAIVDERVGFFDDAARVAERSAALDGVADAANDVARRLEEVAGAASNEDLQIALTEAMTDEELLALIGDVDRWVQDACTNAPE